MEVDIYIISTGGVPVYIHSELLESDDQTLFSGLLTAIQAFLTEIHIGEAKSFTTDLYNVTIYPEDRLAYVFITHKKSKIDEKSLDDLYNQMNLQILPLSEKYSDYEFTTDMDFQGLVEFAVSNVLIKWKASMKESVATKKAKESLW